MTALKVALFALFVLLAVTLYNSEYAAHERECSFRPVDNVTECR